MGGERGYLFAFSISLVLSVAMTNIIYEQLMSLYIKNKLLLTKQSIIKKSLRRMSNSDYPTTEHKSNPTQVAEKIMSLSHFGVFWQTA